MNRKAKKYQQYTSRVAILGNTQGRARTATELREKYHFVSYWSRKLSDPNFHAGTVGGARHVKFDDEKQAALEALLWNELKRNPLQSAPELQRFVQNQGFNVNTRCVDALLRRALLNFALHFQSMFRSLSSVCPRVMDL